MTTKKKNAKRTKGKPRPAIIDQLQASIENDLLLKADEEAHPEGRWSRPRKSRISLRLDAEVLDWLQSKGPGYQTRINRVLRTLMVMDKKQTGKG